MAQLTLDLAVSRARRDEGLARTSVKNADYMESALQLLRVLASQREFVTGEGIRVFILARVHKPPSSPHFWGALTNTAVRRGILKDTGRVEHMISAASHARRTPVWEFVR